MAPPANDALDKACETFTDGEVIQILSITPEERKHTGVIIDQVVQALHKAFAPNKVYCGGSYKKDTCLRNAYDVDIVTFLNGFDQKDMDEYKARGQKALSGAGIKFKVKKDTPYSVKVECATDFKDKPQLDFDILFTGDAGAPRPPDASDRFYRAAESQENDKLVMDALGKHPCLRKLIVLSKHWKRQQQWQHYGVTSFYVELVCMQVFSKSPDADLQTGFRDFLELVAMGEDMTKANGKVTLSEEARAECKAMVQQEPPPQRHRVAGS